jgi:YVTN family beta-propeller protein
MTNLAGTSSAARAVLLTGLLFGPAAGAAAAATPYFTSISLPAGDAPGGIAANPATNRIYVTDGGSASSPGAVWVIDGNTNKVAATIATSVKGFKAIAVNRASNKVYVANQGAASVTVIDGATNAVSATVQVPGCPTGIDVNPYLNRIYVSSQCGQSGDNIYVIDGATDTLTSIVMQLAGVAGSVAVDPINNQIYAAVSKAAFTTELFDGRTNQLLGTNASVSALSVDPYVPLLWGLPANNDSGLIFVDANNTATTIASNVKIVAVVVDSGTRRAYAIGSGTSPPLLIADRNNVIDTLTAPKAVAAVAMPLALIPEKRLFILNADRTVSALQLAYDLLSIGSVSTKTTSATVPVYLKDAAATPLGGDSTARFSLPGGLAIDGSGSLLVADIFNQTVRKVTATGAVSTIAGSPGGVRDDDGGPAAAAHLLLPYGIAVNAAGDIYIADYVANQVRKIAAASGTISTVAGTGTQGFSGDGGPALLATLSQPTRLAVDAAGNLYISDSGNARVRRVDAATGNIATIAGNGSRVASGDGGQATAAGMSPFGIAVDASGNLFIADDANRVIRKVTASTGTITTFAGTVGVIGTDDGTGAAASFNLPKGIAADSSGNLFVSDFGSHSIRKITAAGVVTTVAGLPGSAGAVDGTGHAARLNSPFDVAVAGNGTLFISDYLNSTIRKVDSAGSVTTLAGVAARTGTTDGGPLQRIKSVTFTIYISDTTKILGCTDAIPSCSVRFSSDDTNPATVESARGSDSLLVKVIWNTPPVFAATDPGDLIGNLKITLSSSAKAGDEIGLILDKTDSPLTLSATGAAGATETIPDLLYSNGKITVEAPVCDVAPTPSAFLLTYHGATSGCSSGNATPCSTNEAVSFTLLPRSYTLQSCDTISWSFGDGSVVVGTTTPTHAFSLPGSYTATVTISNTTGVAKLSLSVTIASAAVCVVPCSATVPAFALVGQGTTFTGAASPSACANVPVFLWDFGDGSTLEATTAQTIAHTYSSPGTYRWILTVITDTTACLRSGDIMVGYTRPRPSRH